MKNILAIVNLFNYYDRSKIYKKKKKIETQLNNFG